MTKVHPKSSSEVSPPDLDSIPITLTVWKKSLLLNCSGFTVFNSKGNLVFRVDNYLADQKHKQEVELMDAAGKPLLTMRRKKLCLLDSWRVLYGEGKSSVGSPEPVFWVKKKANFVQMKRVLANVYRESPCCKSAVYGIEGNSRKRCYQVLDESRTVVAEIKMKEAAGGVDFGGDVFQLIVEPGFDPSFAMALVILLDQMF